MSKSGQKRHLFERESLDLVTGDIEAFRAQVSTASGAISQATRSDFDKLDAATIDDIYNSLLPTLRHIHTGSAKKSLRLALADTYELSDDESAIMTDALRDNRVHRLLANYAAALPRDTQQTIMHLFENKTAPEQTALIEQYFAFQAYNHTASRAFVSYVDPYDSRRTQRKVRARINREQQTYGESLKQHRENVAYRLRQLSGIYNGLIEEIIEANLDPEALLALATNYDRKTRTTQKQSAKLTTLAQLISPLINRTIDKQPDQQAAIDTAAHAQHVASRVIALSDVQRAHLAEAVDEYRTLALDYSRIRSQKKSVASEKLLVI